MEKNRDRTYLCIDLKSFYASVECVERGLDPFTTNLVVADPERTEKTICLAITPAMKKLGVANRCRVFEIPPAIDYIMAKPRMARYMEVSAEIYGIYLRYVSPEDIHVYSIDECFIDATPYLALYGKTPREFARMLMDAVFKEKGICATAGIGTNLFLAKVALDITAKHVKDGIGYLDEEAFKRQIWHHKPITDIWNIGPGIARRLARYGVDDLHGVTELEEKTLYKEFGINAEYLIDHAYGREPCTIADIQAYTPQCNSLSNGQVLPCDYTFQEARVIAEEMADALCLELVEKGLSAARVSLRIAYAKSAGRQNDKGEENADGETQDGRRRVKPQIYVGEHGPHWRNRFFSATGGSRKLDAPTDSRKKLMAAVLGLYDETTDTAKPIRRLNIGFENVAPREFETLDLFTDMDASDSERELQSTISDIKHRFGKNSLLRAVSLTEKATARERNEQVGGHRA